MPGWDGVVSLRRGPVGRRAGSFLNVFGIGTDWSIGGGVYVQDGSVPDVPQDNATQAADLIGQGKGSTSDRH